MTQCAARRGYATGAIARAARSLAGVGARGTRGVGGVGVGVRG